MNFKKFRINQTLLIEFVSVFLAVFLGFMANQWRDSYNNSKLAKQTVENIQFEIRNNSKTLTGMLANHKVQQKKIDRLMEIIDDPKATENITLDFPLQKDLDRIARYHMFYVEIEQRLQREIK